MNPLLKTNRRYRKDYSKIKRIIDLPDLIEIQKRSYQEFLQKDIVPEKREDVGLQRVFSSVFPIKDFTGTASLEFVSYGFDKPKYDVLDCKQRGMTYSAHIRVNIRLVVWDIDDATGAQSIRDIKEQEIYFGEIPLMTDQGTFVINGTERVVVSQLHRSPGIFFEYDRTKSASSGKIIYSARIIPYRGSWVDFEFDPKDLLYVRIDRRRKFYVTTLLQAFGYTKEELLNYFYQLESVNIDGKNMTKKVNLDVLAGQKAPVDIKHPKTNEVLVRKGRKYTRFSLRKIEAAKLKEIPVGIENIVGYIAADDIVNTKTGEVIVESNDVITEEKYEEIKKGSIKKINIIFIDNINIGSYLRDTLLIDKINNATDAIIEIYRKMRPGDPPTLETATNFLNNLFFNIERYSLSKVGRLKINHKFRFDVPLTEQTLRKEDFLAAVKYLIELKDGKHQIDDIDHLGNRRIRSVGELVENQYRIGLVRMERAIRERMSLQEVETLMPHELVNAKPVNAVIKEFFGTSQLSQFMDQTNPLSEITHKRRLSALGPGGMTRERAGFEVRDVHTTHYGRICPIETPEGPNIGLIASLSSYARVNEFGFIETPYRKVDNGVVSNKVIYSSALEEEGHIIAQANAPIDEKGKFLNPVVSARKAGEFAMANSNEIDLMDVSPNQLVSIAASLVPFLEHDDANRALMGSNMQRQAVPLLKASAPLIGTGIERKVAADCGGALVAKNSGVVDMVDASRIVIKIKEKGKGKKGGEADIYNLIKFQKSNQNTGLNQKPIVSKGDYIEAGETIADGSAMDVGELALGQNVLVAFMPWRGYNFEDSILISERLVKEDSYTSIHIEEFECIARDTKLGKEEITRDIPNVLEEALMDLDETGIVRIGAEVFPSSILVGKITPKGETQLSPEEKLLRAIFGEKAGDVRDTSLRVPPGVEGIVIGVKVFSREGIDKDVRSQNIEDQEIQKLLQDQEDEIKIIKENTYEKIAKILTGKVTSAKLHDDSEKKVLINKSTKLTRQILDTINPAKYSEISLKDGDEAEREINTILINMNEQIDLVRMLFNDKIDRLRRGDELPPGIIKMVKVAIASKRRVAVGDKMAGRHGNKGVVSRILPEEDMPYMNDGTPVDIVLNPLGVPSRMNVGQILETHLGWASRGLALSLEKMIEEKYNTDNLKKYLKKMYASKNMSKLIDESDDKDIMKFISKVIENKGIHMSSNVFDGATEEEINNMLELAGLDKVGQVRLRDGKTGEAFDHLVTIGMMYVMKLHHMVEDKIHARSIGPYSLVTQQPLGGKAQFGGQRLGEMEVWALEAYGAAYALQEFLTVKSDDIHGRTKMYESIVKGEAGVDVGLPESFKVLLKELHGLALNVELREKGEE